MQPMKRWIYLGLLLTGLLREAPAQTDGIFADFSTSMGNFTVWLDYERAPRAVANFVGLATGEAGWADPQGNVWHKPFYDGSIFHRVAKVVESDEISIWTNGIAIQGGGLPTYAVGTADRPTGVSTSVYAGLLVVTNEPGVNTNILNLPVPTTYAAAIPTHYVLDGQTVQTNAPMMTFVQTETEVVSSNRWVAGITNRGVSREGYTNFSLVAQATTLVSQVIVVITNSSGTNVVTTHSIGMEVVSSNVVREPAVATNFVNAGYTMLENVTNGLAHSNGVISMANSGPNSDGSQFFITATNAPGWNGGYSAFGHVSTGMDVVASIAAVEVMGERPVEDVVVHSVAIRRVGAAATNFDIAEQGVPVVESGPVRTYTAGTNIWLEFDLAEQSETLFRVSDDLKTWESSDWGLGIQTNARTLTRSFPRVDLGPATFFHASRIRYPVPITSPLDARGRKFTFFWDVVPPIKYEVVFSTNWNVQGNFVLTQGTNAPVGGTVFLWDAPEFFWSRKPYSGRLSFMDGVFRSFKYSMGFNPNQVTNRFKGYWGSGLVADNPISGTFTVQ